MNKLNSTIYNRLLLQANEAKERDMTKLASVILEAIGDGPEDNLHSYSYSQLNDDVYLGFWKMATQVIKYYDTKHVDSQKLNETIEALANKFIQELEQTLETDSVVIGPLEPKVFGEK